ncbi:MAG: type II CRISPR RNA-guided endonuclease Cas9 [Bacteroidaceae bacterium]|nr:type II CRISPR RNA-guided endonuclease Cas9 [Bacteroidaceae bacterium]
MKKILGLDLGTNSIGWAVVDADEIARENATTFLKPYTISSAGSRIIPMSADIIGDFERGNSISQTAERTRLRMVRRLRERNLLRRERLLRTLNTIGFLPEHFTAQINRYGKFIDDTEPKLAWRRNAEGKMEFLFQDSFNEMLADFAMHQPQLIADGKKVPYDWTIYFLRKKALTQRISKEELAWILLQFNQKRGYYQLRGEEEEEKSNETIEIISAQILSVEQKEKDKKYEKYWYEMNLDNGMVYRASFYNDVSKWKGETKDFVLKTTVLKDGSKKNELSFLPTTDEIERMDPQRKAKMYAKIKLRTEKDIENSHKTVGSYIYDALLQKPDQKIIGKLVRTIERKFYKEELIRILETQQELIPELKNEDLYNRCIEELYSTNEAHRNNISKPDFVNLFVNDILFYQRPLKSKKSLIDNCPYEFHTDKDGNIRPIKCIAKSNPLFQEFRLWQFVQNLRIYQRERITSDGQLDLFGNTTKGNLQTDVDVTEELLKNEDDYVKLFEWLNDRSTIKQDTLLNSYFKIKKEKGKDKYPFRWNYVEDKEYPCNETRATILAGLSKCGINTDILTHEKEMKLWHILYSVEDKVEIGKAMKNYADKNNLNDNFAEVFSKLKPFKKEYGSYSEKAIRKLLPLMRMGKYWNKDNFDTKTLERIERIITGEFDDTIKNRVREKAIKLTETSQFKGLPVWLACYIVYDRHSEAKEVEKWEKPEDIDRYLSCFKQHSLRNPIVEQVITETLRTVRDIWKKEGQIDEIHVELGREMKNPADKRRQMTERIQQNENTNLRIKAMLMEFANPDMHIENVRPFSPSQQDILRIYEENALENLTKEDEQYEFIAKVSKMAQPSKSDIIRYKCWLEQKYQSPYTGNFIPLSRLFTTDYEIEHVIPRALYFDDSFSNKVICESEVNSLKDRQLGYEFIKKNAGRIVPLSQGGTVQIQTVEAYEKFVKDHYATNRIKMKKLLMEDIPDDFIERQLNDSRYISKVVKSLLSNIVREKQENGEYEQEAVSKNLISCNGTITDRLKKDWGMNDVWNSIILPRFQRLNQLTGKNCFTTLNKEGHEIPNMPIELQKGFNKKRIDHRHHAMDAIVIACATRDHVNLLNNEAAHSKHNVNRYQLQKKLRRFDKAVNGYSKEIEVAKEFLMPWQSFTTDARQVLENIIVSFKQNLRVINKTTNSYQHYDSEGKKKFQKQTNGDSWAVRKSMHKDTVFGEVNLRKKKTVSLNEALNKPSSIVNKDFKKKVIELLNEGRDTKYIKKYVEDNKDVWSDINPAKIEVYYFTKDEKKRNGEPKERYFATRKSIDSSFDQKKIKESVTDTGIQKILLAHLAAKENNPEQAFSPDGVEEMNRNIVALNKGKFHQPILKIRVYEKADKFSVGQTGNKTKKFVEAAKGTNLFWAILGSEKINKETCKSEIVRSYLTIPLNIMIDCQKKYGSKWKVNIETYLKEKDLINAEEKLLFTLSPNDLVYLPTKKEAQNNIEIIDKKRIYKFIDPGMNTGNFIPFTVAKTIFSTKFSDQKKIGVEIPIQDEFGLGSQGSKSPRSITGEMIKETCIPIKVDRLGNIIKIG